MSFYYGSSEPPPEDKPAGFRETLVIIGAVFGVLALPLGIILGIFMALVAVAWLFAVSPLAGGLAILAIVAALVGYGVWEAKHPPSLK